MKNQKGFASIVLIAALVILIGVVSYVAWRVKSVVPVANEVQNNNNNNSPEIPATNDVVNSDTTVQTPPNTTTSTTVKAFSTCLPSGIKLTDVVSAHASGYSGGQPTGLQTITVKQKLTTLKAKCRDGKLVDATNKQITFYHLQGCWGNPPQNYQEILQKQQDEITKLKAKYTVIEMTCNPTGRQIE